jgi:hypothetical protein
MAVDCVSDLITERRINHWDCNVIRDLEYKDSAGRENLRTDCPYNRREILRINCLVEGFYYIIDLEIISNFENQTINNNLYKKVICNNYSNSLNNINLDLTEDGLIVQEDIVKYFIFKTRSPTSHSTLEINVCYCAAFLFIVLIYYNYGRVSTVKIN